MAHLVGGTEMSKGDISVKCERPAYRSEIERVNYDARELALKDELPGKILDNAVALIRTPHNQDAWNLESVAGKKAIVQKRISYYQSVVESVNATTGMIATERELDAFGADTEISKGTILSNESGDKVWRTAYAPIERWMYLGWPNTDLSSPRAIRMEDVPDVDKDGRHVLKLMGSGGETEPKDKVILELEVTRCDPENFTFYFKMPENEEYQTGGWQFANRWLTNEDGSKRWWATYPGTVNAWKLENYKDLSLESFPDADGDGKRKVRAYHFGGGDMIEIKTFVHVQRTDKGYEVRANAPCSIKLPGMKDEVKLGLKELVAGPVILPAAK
jgi:hypothetical protein